MASFLRLAWSGTKVPKGKRDRLLRRNFDDMSAEGFRNRNLNDTGWVVRPLLIGCVTTCVSRRAVTAVAEQPVLTPSGGFTSFLRTRWGLYKDRESSDLHHAQDVCVIAAATPALIKRVSDYNRKRETLEILPGGADCRRHNRRDKEGRESAPFRNPGHTSGMRY